jgi:hypothetical protein
MMSLYAHQYGLQRKPVVQVIQGQARECQERSHGVAFSGGMRPCIKIRETQKPYGCRGKEKNPQ